MIFKSYLILLLEQTEFLLCPLYCHTYNAAIDVFAHMSLQEVLLFAWEKFQIMHSPLRSISF